MGEQYDIFFSYTHTDKAAVEPLLAALTARSLRVFRDVTDITDGQSISRRVAEGLSNARMLVAWYSKTYPTRRSCQWELTAAIIAAQQDTSDTQAVERRILALNPEAGVSHIQPLHVRDQLFISTAAIDPSELADKVAARLTGLERSFSQFHRMSRPHRYGSKMRLGSNRFVGRIPDLWAIHSGLSQHNFAMSGGASTGLVQVQGMGGTGKTLLAEEYALRFGAAYPGGIFWLSAMAGESRSTQILRVAGHLELATANLNPNEVEGLLRGTLSKLDRYLWIVDDLPADANHDTLLEWSAPSSNGATLVTTRNKRLNGSGFVHSLDVLSPDEAFELLTNRLPPRNDAEQSAAQEILTLLGNHALAVEVTGAAIEAESYQFICDLLRSPQEDALEFAAKLADDLPGGHAPSIAATLLASIRRLNEDGLILLHLAALLAPAPIPRSLVPSIFTLFAEDEQTGRKQAALGIKAVADEALIERIPGADEAADAILVHVLVSRTIRFHVGESPPKLRGAAVAALTQRMEEAGDIRNHSDLLPLVPHARALTERLSDAPTAILLGWLGRFAHERGAYAEAEADGRKMFESSQQLLGAEHFVTFTSMSNLAETLRAQGDHAGARAFQEKALMVGRQVLGSDHPDTLTCMNNLASTLWAQGDHAGARAFQEEVLTVGRQVLGLEHPVTLNTMNNLASTLWAQGDHASAWALEEEALTVRRRMLGAEHPVTLTSMSNLAETLRVRGDHAGARALHEEALTVRRRMLGAEHPDTLISMNNLAATLGAQGNYVGARMLQEEALTVRRRVLGAEHPATLTSMNNLAVTLFHLGKVEAARALVAEALPIALTQYGPKPEFSQALIRTAIALGLSLPPGIEQQS